jgi:PGF-pre-PGF domain-containing protein
MLINRQPGTMIRLKGKMKARTNLWKREYVFVIIILISLLPFAGGQPMPLGVDGTVYDLDEITKAGSNVMFSVHDIDSGFYTEGNLRQEGRYSAVINGIPGDIVFVKVWTQYHNSSNNFTLTGSMHGFDILLDLSLPEMPPEIKSSPLTEAYEDSLYSYDVNATDPNGDMLYYSFLEAPKDMEIGIQTGIITWLPLEKDVGLHTVIINVSDGEMSDTQEYILEVINVTSESTNHPPLFISTPVAKATLWNLYRYDADANDSDNDAIVYSLISKPNFMYIDKNTGKIFWIPYKTGDFKVVIAANDSKEASYQEYVIRVEKGFGNYFASLTEFNGTANRVSITNTNLELMNILYTSDKQDNLLIYSGKSQEYFNVQKPRDKLYKYLMIFREEDIQTFGDFVTSGKITFRVKKTWVSGFSPQNIRLTHYNYQTKKWESLITTMKKENWEYYFYETEIQSLGTFAIVANVSKEIIQKEMDNLFYKNQFEQPKRPFIVTGKISLEEAGLSSDGFDYELQNLNTGESAKGKIMGNVYSEVLSGNQGDEYNLVISRGEYRREVTSRITGDLTRQDMTLDMDAEQYKEIVRKEKMNEVIPKMLIFGTGFGILVVIISFYFIKKRWK